MNQNRHRFAHFSMLALLFLFGCKAETRDAGEWPQWRGPSGTGVSIAESLPVHWDEDGTGVRWQVKVPDSGISSPIVSGGQIFLTSEEQQGTETELKVLSFDLEDGALQWETSVFSRGREEFPPRSAVNSPAGPTPLADGRSIFAYFGSHLTALDYGGRVLWTHEIDSLYLTDVTYGAGSSLVSVGNKIIVFKDRENPVKGKFGWLAAFDKKTGEQIWRQQWSDTCCSFTTPILIERDAGRELVVSLAGRVVAYDPETGEVLWRRKHGSQQPVASPVAEGELICAATGAHLHKALACWALRDQQRPKELWTWRKGIPETASPVMYNGLLFTVNDRGLMISYDARTGRRHWGQRLPESPYFASLVAGDGKIYATSRSGLVSVIAATPRFNLLARNRLPGDGQILASPAVADGCLIVRTGEQLLCVEGSDEAVDEGGGGDAR